MKTPLLALLLVAAVYAVTNSTDPFAKISQVVDSVLNSVDSFLQNLKHVIQLHVVSISKTLSVILALVGALLYLSGINKYGGRGMLIGAVLLYLLAEFVQSI